MSALARADSLALDPHKWLYVPVEAGLVLVRDAEAMRATFSLVPSYLRTDGKAEGVGGLPWFSEYGFQQTRGFRALKVWMALKHYGLAGYRASIDRDLQLAEYLAAGIRAAEDLTLFEPTGLSIVCFRYTPRSAALDDTATDRINRALLEAIQLRGEVFLSSTTIEGRYWLRACIVNHRADASDIDALLRAVRAEGDQTVYCGPPEPSMGGPVVGLPP